MIVSKNGCSKCYGPIILSLERLPDKTYDMYCLTCGNRDFPDEAVLIADTLRKLKTKWLPEWKQTGIS